MLNAKPTFFLVLYFLLIKSSSYSVEFLIIIKLASLAFKIALAKLSLWVSLSKVLKYSYSFFVSQFSNIFNKLPIRVQSTVSFTDEPLYRAELDEVEKQSSLLTQSEHEWVVRINGLLVENGFEQVVVGISANVAVNSAYVTVSGIAENVFEVFVDLKIMVETSCVNVLRVVWIIGEIRDGG